MQQAGRATPNTSNVFAGMAKVTSNEGLGPAAAAAAAADPELAPEAAAPPAAAPAAAAASCSLR